MLVLVQVVHEARFVFVPADADVAGMEYLAQLVADEINGGLEVELRRHSLLDAVDDSELGVALLDLAAGDGKRRARGRTRRDLRGGRLDRLARGRRSGRPAGSLGPGFRLGLGVDLEPGRRLGLRL